MARTNRIRILNAVASSSFIYRRPTITILVRITASRKGEERAGNDRRYAPCIAGRGHDSVDWIDFRKAGTMVVSERNWIASGCSPDKKRIVSIRRRRENGNRRGNGGGEEVLQKKRTRLDFVERNPFHFFPLLLSPFFPPMLSTRSRSISPSIPSSIDAQKARKPGRIRLDSWKTRFLPSRTARYLFLPVPVPGDNGREKLNFALALPSSSPRG